MDPNIKIKEEPLESLIAIKEEKFDDPFPSLIINQLKVEVKDEPVETDQNPVIQQEIKEELESEDPVIQEPPKRKVILIKNKKPIPSDKKPVKILNFILPSPTVKNYVLVNHTKPSSASQSYSFFDSQDIKKITSKVESRKRIEEEAPKIREQEERRANKRKYMEIDRLVSLMKQKM
jgi:hypothetical protein